MVKIMKTASLTLDIIQGCNWRRCSGDKTGLFNHIGGAKALFSYANLQVRTSAGGQKCS